MPNADTPPSAPERENGLGFRLRDRPDSGIIFIIPSGTPEAENSKQTKPDAEQRLM